jgi:hypothetical protein
MTSRAYFEKQTHGEWKSVRVPLAILRSEASEDRGVSCNLSCFDRRKIASDSVSRPFGSRRSFYV